MLKLCCSTFVFYCGQGTQLKSRQVPLNLPTHLNPCAEALKEVNTAFRLVTSFFGQKLQPHILNATKQLRIAGRVIGESSEIGVQHLRKETAGPLMTHSFRLPRSTNRLEKTQCSFSVI